MRTWTIRAVRVVACLVLGMTTLALSAGALTIGADPAGADQPLSAWTPSEAPATNVTQILNDVICPALGTCDAVGEWFPSAGVEYPLAYTLRSSTTSGTWTTAQLPSPSSSSYTGESLNGISCVEPVPEGNPSFCVAVGVGTNATGQYGLVEQASFNTWTASQLPAPANAAANPNMIIGGVSCAAVGSCVAVGVYKTAAGIFPAPVAEVLSNGTWSASELPAPSSAAPNSSVSLTRVTCLAVGSCIAVGHFTDTSNQVEPLLETLTSGVWTPSGTSVPVNAASNPNAYFNDVTCITPTTCEAVGGYSTSGGAEQGLIETLSSGVWSAAEPPPPANGPSQAGVALTGVSCTAVGACLAVGEYADQNGNEQGLTETSSSGSWTPSEAPLPTNAYSAPDADLSSVACASGGGCEAVGTYDTAPGNDEGLIETGPSPTWNTDNNLDVVPGDDNATSCPTTSFCMVVGDYNAGSPYYQQIAGAGLGNFGAVTANENTSTVTYGLADVSCTSSSFCIAVGVGDNVSFTGGFHFTGYTQLIDEYNGSSFTQLPAPSEAAALTGVSCTSPTFCVAVGKAFTGGNPDDTSGQVIEVFNGSSWSVMANPTFPAGDTPGLFSVSCASTTMCAAVGVLQDNVTPVIELYDGSTWSVSTVSGEANLSSVSCPTATFCAAAGTTSLSSGGDSGALYTFDGTAWSPQDIPSPPDAEYVELEGVSCPEANSCATVGLTTAADGDDVPLIESYDGASVDLEAEPPIEAPSDGFATLSGVSCANEAFCLAVGVQPESTIQIESLDVSGSAPAPAASSTSVTASPDPSVYGEPVTFTATVSPTDGGGTVAFYAGGSATPIGGCASQALSLVSGSYQATCTTAGLAAGTTSISATYTGDPAYPGSSGNLPGGQSVSLASLEVTASSGQMSYGGNPPAITASYSGFVNGDTAASLTTAPTCATTATSSSPVGSYPSSCSGASDPNYMVTYRGGSVAVSAVPLVITASNGEMTYGGSPPSVTASYSGFVNGDTAVSLSTAPTCSTAATSSSAAGTYASSCSGAADPNYTLSYENGTVAVDPAPLVISASSGTMTYGATQPAITASYAGFVNGDTAASLASAPTCSTTATTSSPVGSYASSCTGASDPNYSISYVNGSVTVGQASLVIQASSESSTYGSAPGSITPSFAGFANGEGPSNLGGDLTCSTEANASSPVGAYASSCSGASDPNYTITYVNGSVDVTPAPLTVTASSATNTYGGTPTSVTAGYSGFVNGDTAGSLTTPPTCGTSATSTSPAGSYPSSCSGATDANYTITYTDGSITVNRAPLSVTASSGTMGYGGAAPSVSASYTGFVNGDTTASLSTVPTCMTSATSSSAVGTYGSSCSGAADANYTITYVDGSVTVDPAPLSVTASSGTMTYGGAAPTITASYAGFVNGDAAESLSAAPTCTTAATPSSPVGSYGSSCTGAVDPNYTITYDDGSVAVTPAALSATASSGSMTYGGTPPTITASYAGFVNGDAAESLSAAPTCTTAATPSSPVGSYGSSCTGAVDPNYTITYAGGSVAVIPAPLVIAASSAAMTYGGTPPMIAPVYSGFVNGDSASSLSAQPTCSTTASSSTPAGSYPSACTGASDPNYSISYANGSVVVGQAQLVISASSGTMTYGGPVPTITPSYAGFVNGDSFASLTSPPRCSTEASGSSPVGTYTSSCSGAVDPNYTITYVDGSVAVGPAPLAITASSEASTYGTTPGAVTPSFSGFVEGQGPSVLGGGLTCSTSAAASSPVGSYLSSCSGAVDPNYTITYAAGSVDVTPAPLTVTASGASMTYGGTAPSVTAGFSGFVNGDSAAALTGRPTCSTTATASSQVGSYASSCSGAVDPNYAISYTDGSVSVTPATLVVTASSPTMTYESTVPAVTPIYWGFVNDDGTSSLTKQPICSTTATESSQPGTYPTSCSGAVDPDYSISYVNGALTLQLVAGVANSPYYGTGPDLVGANLAGKNLQNDQKLVGADLAGADLQGANLQGADLDSVDLQGADLQGANLQGASLDGSNLVGANLAGVNLQKGDLSDSDLQDADLAGSNLQGTTLAYDNLQGSDLKGANLQGDNLTGTNLAQSDLQGANMQSSEMTNADLDGANVQGASTQSITWSNTTCPDGTNSSSHSPQSCENDL
jgi:uncharacterized protein YjbI with pentapeptide repeats